MSLRHPFDREGIFSFQRCRQLNQKFVINTRTSVLKSRDCVILQTYNTYGLDNFVQLFTNRDRIIPSPPPPAPPKTFAPKLENLSS